MQISRSQKNRLSAWWFTVDWPLLTGLLVLVAIGLLVSLAAGPTVAIKRGLPPYYFVERHFLFALAGTALMLAVSLLRPFEVRRLALLVYLAGVAAMAVALLLGPEINGAKRWLRLMGYSLQPSEFVKPAFVILAAWLLAEKQRKADFPVLGFAVALYGLTAGLLLIQPDLGQTLLITAVWAALLFVAGMPLGWLAAMAGAAIAILAAGYAAFGHVRRRLEAFFDPAAGDTYQMDRARQSFIEGGWLGRGPGEGTVKATLPDAHTDFIFAVIAEEYGIVACLVLIGVFAFVVARAFVRLLQLPEGFERNGAIGLVALFAFQALINMGVNVGLLPAKGMTLPFVSYGGSSLLGQALAMGLLLALTRARPRGVRLKNTALLASQVRSRMRS